MEPYKGGFLADVPEEAEKIMKEYNPDRSVVSWAMRFVANPCMRRFNRCKQP